MPQGLQPDTAKVCRRTVNRQWINAYYLQAYKLAARGYKDGEIGVRLSPPLKMIAWATRLRKDPDLAGAIAQGRIEWQEKQDRADEDPMALIHESNKKAVLMGIVECGTPSGACKAAGMTPYAHRNWMAKDPNYRRAYAYAKKLYAASLVKEATRRAVSGTRSYKFTSRGERVMVPCQPDHEDAEQFEEDGKTVYMRHYYELNYSDGLMGRLLEANIPHFDRYKRAKESNVNVSLNNQTNILQTVLQDAEKGPARVLTSEAIEKFANASIELEKEQAQQALPPAPAEDVIDGEFTTRDVDA